jgi:Zn-dependent protease/CBS domain-containing protein
MYVTSCATCFLSARWLAPHYFHTTPAAAVRRNGGPGHLLWDHQEVFGGRSIKIADVFGIRIGVDPSWFIVLFLVIWSLSGLFDDVYPGQAGLAFGLAVVTALLFFASVLLHELGHATVAIRNGIEISGIDLWLFGGIAKLSRDTDSAGLEFRVAIAGPLVSLLIAVGCGLGVLASVGTDRFLDALTLYSGSAPPPVVAVLAWLALINATLLLFNLIPGFPLDGGRIVRSIAWGITGDRLRATRFAAALGRLFSFAFIGIGIGMVIPAFTSGDQSYVMSGLWLALIGLFLGQAARSSRMQSELTARLEGLTVGDVMDAQPVAVPLGLSLDRVLEEFLLRYRWPWFPVVDADGRLVGLVVLEAVEAVPEAERPATPVDQVMARDPEGALRAPVDQSIESFLQTSRDALQRLGAVMAVDADGVLRGVITLQQVRRALGPTGG